MAKHSEARRTPLTDDERRRVAAIGERLERLRAFLADLELSSEGDASPTDWFEALAAMKQIVGNASIDLSFVACLLAKDYLSRRFEMRPFDVTLKPQAARGLDIDARTVRDERVIAEIKTTTPYKIDEFGGKQKDTVAKDLDRLRTTDAAHRFFFVTDPSALEVISCRYASRIEGIEVVLLPSDSSRCD